MDAKFAENFIPVFKASDLAVFIGKPRELTKLKFIRKFAPFKDIYIEEIVEIKTETNQKPKVSLNIEEKEFLNAQIKESFEITEEKLIFNDDKVIKSFSNRLYLPSDKYVGQEITEEYFTAESDEETFKESAESVDEVTRKLKQAKFFVSTQRGKYLERNILDKINRENGTNFIINKQRKYMDFGAFKIVGIIDGIDTDKKMIIEIKTRSKMDDNKNTITNKEKIQSLVYMKMYDCASCLFIENGSEGKVKKTTIDWDEVEFEKVVNKLESFTLEMRQLSENDFKNLMIKYHTDKL